MTLEKHWVGNEWEFLEGSLVLLGILEEARAALEAMAAATKTNYKNSFLDIYGFSLIKKI